MSSLMSKQKTCELSLSTLDGRVIMEDELIATRVTLGNIPKEKEFVEIDLQLIVKRKDAETIYNALASGVIYIEASRAQTT